MSKELVEAKIREKLGNDNVKWCSDVDLEIIEDKRTVVIAIKDANYKENMQKDEACFEGWALALKTYFLDGDYDIVELKCDKILVPAKGKLDKDFGKGFDHSNRFLYRALRFSEQYKDWFRLETHLQEKVERFKKYLDKHKEKLLNNVPNEEASKVAVDVLSEKLVESLIAANPTMLKPVFKNENVSDDVWKNDLTVAQQLPVGLFEGKVETENRVFPGRTAAIDLWAYHTLQPNEFYIFELKFQNKMLGIISEIFFYANYMYDLLTYNGCFKLSESRKKKSRRGYNKIKECNNRIDTVNAVMLADKGNMHPAITKELLEVLNEKQGVSINYLRAEYEAEIKFIGNIDVSK